VQGWSLIRMRMGLWIKGSKEMGCRTFVAVVNMGLNDLGISLILMKFVELKDWSVNC
jgi:hypothetical protein